MSRRSAIEKSYLTGNAPLRKRGQAIEARDAAVTARDEAVAALNEALADDTTSAETIAGLREQIGTLNATIGSAGDAADMGGSLNAQINYHSGEVTRLNGMIGSADDAADMGGSLNAQINYHSGEVTRLNGMIGSADDAPDAEGSLHAQLNQAKKDYDDLKAQVDDDETKMARETRIKNAGAQSAAISVAATDNQNDTNAANDATAAPHSALSDSDNTKNYRRTLDVTGITPKRTAAGSVSVNAAVPAASDLFTGDAGTVAEGAAWTGVMLSRSTTGTSKGEEDLAVYTDIGAPSNWPIAADFESNQTYVAIASDASASIRNEVDVDVAPKAGGDPLIHGQNSSFSGSFRDIPGSFKCVDSCTVSTSTKGKTSVSGALQFTPTDNTDTYEKQDSAYTSFGWWLRKPASGAQVAEVFATTTGYATANVSLNAVTDETTATYSGMAAGRYTTESYTAGVQTDADVGSFTADAELTATFGAANADTIKGTIDNFTLSGVSDGTHWAVNLNSTSIADGGIAEAQHQRHFRWWHPSERRQVGW